MTGSQTSLSALHAAARAGAGVARLCIEVDARVCTVGRYHCVCAAQPARDAKHSVAVHVCLSTADDRGAEGSDASADHFVVLCEVAREGAAVYVPEAFAAELQAVQGSSKLIWAAEQVRLPRVKLPFVSVLEPSLGSRC